MRLLAEPRAAIKECAKTLARYSKFVKFSRCLERIKKVIAESSTRSGRQLRAAVLRGPRDLKLERVPEQTILPTQIRVDVRFCGLTESDVLLWRGEHRRIPERNMVLGYAVSGIILEIGRLARESTSYRIGEEVVVHNYPVCGGLAENCLADRKPIAVCEDTCWADFCADLGATVVLDGSEKYLRCKLREISGTEKARLLIETEGGMRFRSVVKWLEHDGLIAFLGCVRDKRHPDVSLLSLSNYTVFAVAAEHYKIADVLIYRETMQQLLDYESERVIRPHISAIFGLHRVNEAFDYCTTMPKGKVLIDMKDCDRLSLYDEF